MAIEAFATLPRFSSRSFGSKASWSDGDGHRTIPERSFFESWTAETSAGKSSGATEAREKLREADGAGTLVRRRQSPLGERTASQCGLPFRAPGFVGVGVRIGCAARVGVGVGVGVRSVAVGVGVVDIRVGVGVVVGVRVGVGLGLTEDPEVVKTTKTSNCGPVSGGAAKPTGVAGERPVIGRLTDPPP